MQIQKINVQYLQSMPDSCSNCHAAVERFCSRKGVGKCLDILDSMQKTLSLTVEDCRIDLGSPANAELCDIIERIKDARNKTELYGEEHKDTDGKYLI